MINSLIPQSRVMNDKWSFFYLANESNNFRIQCLLDVVQLISRAQVMIFLHLFFFNLVALGLAKVLFLLNARQFLAFKWVEHT